MNAAIIYQHTGSAADRAIAHSLSAQVEQGQDEQDDEPEGGPAGKWR